MTAVRPMFRVLAWVLGPLLLGAGLLLVILDLIGRRPREWPDWTHTIHLGLWLGFGNMFIGLLILRTARTGKGHYTIAPDSAAGAEGSRPADRG